ncbi:MAG: hypothetical protein LBS32_02995, partial [Clostridiales Family XIII bacterium]|nr:hypothetical protein [Clostridiales Family XIII bacterium]
MIRSIGLHTYEIDDPAAAVAEIKKELEGFALLENTLGIIMCCPEYVESGVYGAICGALDFPLVGATTTTQAVCDQTDILILTILVLTSDDVFFEPAMTDDIKGNEILAPSRAAFQAARDKLPSEPKLILMFPPMLPETAGDAYVEAFEELCPGVPQFGMPAISDSPAFDDCLTLLKGESSPTKMSFVLLAGNVKPRFLISTLQDDDKMPFSGEITKSK